MDDVQRERTDNLRRAEQKENRLNYLRESKAIPTPVEVYAIWLELYLRQGGKISRSLDRNYIKKRYVDENSNAFYGKDEPEVRIKYEDFHWAHWTPTADGGQIPENYGSNALTLLILPEVTGQDIRPATTDTRAGWEWGHTKVLTIVRDDTVEEGFIAETNYPYGAETFLDVEALRKSMDIYQMLAKYNMVRNRSVMETGAWVEAIEERKVEEPTVEEPKPEEPKASNEKGFLNRFLGL